jgi:hypothetical protein
MCISRLISGCCLVIARIFQFLALNIDRTLMQKASLQPDIYACCMGFDSNGADAC